MKKSNWEPAFGHWWPRCRSQQWVNYIAAACVTELITNYMLNVFTWVLGITLLFLTVFQKCTDVIWAVIAGWICPPEVIGHWWCHRLNNSLLIEVEINVCLTLVRVRNQTFECDVIFCEFQTTISDVMRFTVFTRSNNLSFYLKNDSLVFFLPFF